MRVVGERHLSSSHPLPYADLLVVSDERLVEQVLAGNADAFAVLFKRHHRLVHVIALRILRDAGEAEDLTQAVFLEVYRDAVKFDATRGSVRGWLATYAHSRSINRRNYLLVRQFHKHIDLDAAESTDSLWSPGRLPVQEARHVTREALSTLSPPQRDTIHRFFFEGASLKEIAALRNETISNVRHHYYRGLDRLRSLFESGETRAVRAARLGDVKRAET